MPNSVSSVSRQMLGSSPSSASLLRQAGDEQERRARLLGDARGLRLGRLADRLLDLVHLGQLGDDAAPGARTGARRAGFPRPGRARSRDFTRCLSAASWSSAAGLAAVLARSPSADCIEPPARIRSFWRRCRCRPAGPRPAASESAASRLRPGRARTAGIRTTATSFSVVASRSVEPVELLLRTSRGLSPRRATAASTSVVPS